MLFPVLSALATCLFFVPIVGRVIANRLSAKQKLHAVQNREAIQAVADALRQAMHEADAAAVTARCGNAQHISVVSLDQVERVVKMI